jgi:cytochrome oxidase assembly protein ShyY1
MMCISQWWPYTHKNQNSLQCIIMATTGISAGGKAFFGSLCAGTFGLGCWQVQRLYGKLDKVEERGRQLEMDPTTDWRMTEAPYRRRLVEGTFRHDKEVLVGLRGAPAGVSLPRKGLSANKAGGGQSAGAAPGPQGFHVLTPLQLKDDNLVWVNRGWVPKTMVPGADRGRPSQPPPPEGFSNWSRPAGQVSCTTIRTAPEKPRIIAIEHDYSKRPLQLFWMDGVALQAIAESDQETVLLTQVLEKGENDDDIEQSIYPLNPPVETVADFKTTPMIHVGYATTWFGLSAAGIYMTRKLITRGRG